MPENVNAYDSGYRLEPKPWSTGAGAASDDFGKVDFTNESGETVFTGWMQKTEAGYILRVDEHQDVELAVETSSQRQTREAAMMLLTQELQGITAQHEKAVSMYEDDPDTFGAGHYVIENTAGDQCLAVTEQYLGTDSSDPDRVPNSWEVDHYTRPHTDARWELRGKRTYGADDVEALIEFTADWVNHRAREQSTHDALHAPTAQASQHQQQTQSAGPTY
ncbi:hypothetical protein [Leucobacter manosquensis]|uniref:Uncharacterized protein n=1 Tax=Leucobacter manosquensis TaxID=2810611 RepID=A0ABS5M5Y3_9MICO|nr:hypothetical protein [Leucobacter manosquensis]MBS3182390.1 hypothetical protein [Leucobacter manosquensis]